MLCAAHRSLEFVVIQVIGRLAQTCTCTIVWTVTLTPESQASHDITGIFV